MPRRPKLAKGLYWHPRTGGIWCRFWHKGREYKRSCSTRDPRAAAVEARRIRVEVEQADPNPGPGRVTMLDLSVWDISKRTGATEGHQRSTESRWVTILRLLPAGCCADEITEKVLAAYEATRRLGAPKDGELPALKPARGQTIVRELGMIWRCLEEAQRRGCLAKLPGERPSPKRDKADALRSGKRWPADLLRSWLDGLHQDARDEALFCAITGLRSAEAKRVTLAMVEQHGQRYVLRLPDEATKTRRERVVGLPAEAAAIVARRVQVEPRPATVFSPSDFRTHRKTVAKRLGYPRAPTLRDLRHTAASLAMEVTSDPTAVMRALGHTDLRMTERYLTSTMDRVAGVAEAVAGVLLPEHSTGAPGPESVVSVARDRGFEPLTFGSGGHSDSAKWLQQLADAAEEERLRAAGVATAPEHLTGAPRRRA